LVVLARLSDLRRLPFFGLAWIRQLPRLQRLKVSCQLSRWVKAQRAFHIIGEKILREELSGIDCRWEQLANKLANNCYNKHQQRPTNQNRSHNPKVAGSNPAPATNSPSIRYGQSYYSSGGSKRASNQHPSTTRSDFWSASLDCGQIDSPWCVLVTSFKDDGRRPKPGPDSRSRRRPRSIVARYRRFGSRRLEVPLQRNS
jgi:hypothetical protein